jgi:SAM-dependent methyltransferase
LADAGVAGLALLRLHASRNPDPAAECVDELRRALDRAGSAPGIEDVRNPVLDVMTGYGRWAQVYDLPGNPLVAAEEPTVRSILDGFDADPVLDAACGTGRHLAYLAARGHSVIGTDISPQMMDKAREKVPAADLRLGDLRRLPLADAEAGAIVCALALDHVDDLRAAYAELGRVVAPGGPVVVSTMHPVLRSVFGWGAWFIDHEGKADLPTHAHEIGHHINAAAAAGLVLRRCEEPPAPHWFLGPGTKLTRRIAYGGLPMVLVLHFERSVW